MDDPFMAKSNARKEPAWKIASVVMPGTGQATVQFAGESATAKNYKCLSGYTPVANDRVLMAWFNGTGVILGKF